MATALAVERRDGAPLAPALTLSLTLTLTLTPTPTLSLTLTLTLTPTLSRRAEVISR